MSLCSAGARCSLCRRSAQRGTIGPSRALGLLTAICTKLSSAEVALGPQRRGVRRACAKVRRQSRGQRRPPSEPSGHAVDVRRSGFCVFTLLSSVATYHTVGAVGPSSPHNEHRGKRPAGPRSSSGSGESAFDATPCGGVDPEEMLCGVVELQQQLVGTNWTVDVTTPTPAHTGRGRGRESSRPTLHSFRGGKGLSCGIEAVWC